jgi:hypothetical protein
MFRDERSRKLRFERLEARELLAGNVIVTVAGSVVTIRGDNQSNSIEISSDDQGASWVRGLDWDGAATSINGQPSGLARIPSKASRIVIDMKDGNDTVTASGFNVRAAIQANMGSGNDTLEINGGEIIGDLTAYMGDGDDYAILTAAKVRGNVAVDLGTGTNFATNYLSPQVTGNYAVSAGKGTTSLEWSGGMIGGNLRADFGPGQSDAWLDSCQIGGSAVLNMRSAGDKSAEVDHATIAKSLSITTGAGADLVAINGSDQADAPPMSPVVGIDTGSGNDQLSFTGAVARDLTVTAGKGGKYLAFFDGASVTRDATIDLRSSQYVFAAVASFTVGRQFTLLTGSGNDVLLISPKSLDPPTPGDHGLTAASATIKTGAGDDYVLLEGAQIASRPQIDLGSGHNTLAFTSGNSSQQNSLWNVAFASSHASGDGTELKGPAHRLGSSVTSKLGRR